MKPFSCDFVLPHGRSPLNGHVMNKGSQQGFTLMELLVVFAVFAAILYGVFALVGAVNNSQMTIDLEQGVASVRQSIQQTFQGRGYPSGDIGAIMAKIGKIPSSWTSASNGSPFTVSGQTKVSITGVDATKFKITVQGMPPEVCNEFLLSQASQRWAQIGNVSPAGGATFVTPTKMTPEAAASNCGSQSNTVDFVSY